jgi:transcriptional regulator
MYRPPHFAVDDTATLDALIAAAPLAVLTSAGANGIALTHVPLLRDGNRLIGHVAKPNPHWQEAPDGTQAVAVFRLADAYVTPNWYASKAEHGRVVPTWNYAAVHVYGRLTWVHDAAAKHGIVRSLTDRHEAREAKPWAVGDAPPEYIAAMLNGIVGLELSVERMEGALKLSQNRTEDDRNTVLLGLSAREDAGSKAISALMRSRAARERQSGSRPE